MIIHYPSYNPFNLSNPFEESLQKNIPKHIRTSPGPVPDQSRVVQDRWPIPASWGVWELKS